MLFVIVREMDIFNIVQTAGQFLDLVGVIIIVSGAVISTVYLAIGFIHEENGEKLYKSYRQNIARGILLGLEFLVAGDVIRTVAGDPSFTSVGVLAIIVLIRTFLGIEFEMEVDGRWPWQKKPKA